MLKKIIVALDSFKGSISSRDAGNALKEGILQADPSLNVKVYSIADGGEGTIESLYQNCGGKIIKIPVQDPLGRTIEADYAILKDHTAVIEMAKASGLPLVEPENRNPLHTSTYGTGQLIAHALDQGVSSIILAIGGSATNDAGIGMLSALGIGFFDSSKNPVNPTGEGLGKICRIDTSNIHPQLKSCSFTVACDVNNPLYGEEGAAYIFGPQKGASLEMIKILDHNLKHFASIIQKNFGIDIAHFPGSGAAGGMGAGLYAFANTVLKSGIEIVLDQIGIDEAMEDADLIFVGEGRLDSQTAMGKAPAGISKRALLYKIPVVAIGGSLEGDPTPLHDIPIHAYFAAVGRPMSLREAMNETEARRGLCRQGRELINLLKIFSP